MKTSKFLLLGGTMAVLSLVSACSPSNSNAESQPPPAPAESAPASPPSPAAVPESPVKVATPATIPSSITPTSPLAQVVRLAQAGVDESIIMVYVTNSSRTFNLDSEKIVYLTDLGLPTDVVTAMMQRDQLLQQQFAASQAELQAQQTQPTQQTQPAPALEPPVASTTADITPPAPVTINYFNDTLSPYGSWVMVNGYGNCWRPAVAVYNPTWQPYCDRGHWVYTDCGWYWNSDYAWGATFHYGRWFRDVSVGWCWYPDTVWAPSWVTWRYSNNYCGWAPLPPRTYIQSGVGIVYQGGGVSVGLSFGLGASCFTFVPTQYFCNPHPRNYCASPSQAAQIYNNTTVINNIRIHGSGNNQIINNGIPVQNVANTTQTPIRPVPVHQIDASFAHNGSGQSLARPSRIDENYSHFNGNGGRPAASPATGQNPPPANFTAGNDNNRAGQNHFSSQVNNQNAQGGQGQFNDSSSRIQTGRINPAPASPQHSTPDYHAPNYPAQSPAANFNPSPQTAPARWQQPAIPHTYTRNPEVRQNIDPQNQVGSPPVNYSAPQSRPEPRIYNQPHNESHQNYSQPSAVSAPQPQHSAPSVVSSPSPQPQNGGRTGNQNWSPR